MNRKPSGFYQFGLFENPAQQLSLFTDEQAGASQRQPVKPAPKVIPFPTKRAKPAAKPRIEDMIDTLTNDELLDMIRNDAFSFRVVGRKVN